MSRPNSSLNGRSGGVGAVVALKAAALNLGWGRLVVLIVLPKNRPNALVLFLDVFKRYAEAPTMDGSRLTLRAALAADLLEDFVRQEEAHGVELEIGSDFERALALLLVQRDLCQERQHGPGPGSPRG